jgi:hypothetical protein
MKKFLTMALVGAMLLGVTSAVYANICAFDVVPAATLLFPFVQYDYNGGGAGANTLFAITNVSSEAQVVHVTLWTDYSVAILDFNIVLTGYDVQTISIRDILADGQLPVTLERSDYAGPEPHSDGPISETNNLVSWYTNLLAAPERTNTNVTCTVGAPSQYTQKIDPPILQLFKDWLQKSQTQTRAYNDNCLAWTGSSAVTSTWWTERDDTTETWMYVTADVVTACNLDFPDTDGYFRGVASYDNVIIGDMIYLDSINNYSEAYQAVHIEADEDLVYVATQSPLDSTRPVSFYHRYSQPDLAFDDREPLPTAWAFRYMNDAANNAKTWVRAFKQASYEDIDSLLTAALPGDTLIQDLYLNPDDQTVSAFWASNCLAYTYYAWDEDEDVLTTTGTPWSQPGVGFIVANLLPLETQEVDVAEFELPGAYGWMLFVWPRSNTAPYATAPAIDLYQTWMGVKYQAFGTYSAGMTATVMANYNCFSDQILPALGIDYEYADEFGYTVSPLVGGAPVN